MRARADGTSWPWAGPVPQENRRREKKFDIARMSNALPVGIAIVLACIIAGLLFFTSNSSKQTAYNSSVTAELAKLQKSHSHYYSLAAPNDHRSFVGGAWDEIGALELKFLKQHGLSTSHTLLDVGCGALRGGVHLVRYLDANLYYGIDLNPHLLDSGYEKELTPLGLASKLPRSHLAASAHFDASQFGVRFDYALSVSVWTHLPLKAVEESLRKVGGVLAHPHGKFYATFYACPEDMPIDSQILQYSGNGEKIVSHGDKDWFHFKVSTLRKAARRAGLRMRMIGKWGHPRHQLMAEFTHEKASASRGRRRLQAVSPSSTLPSCPSVHYPRSLRNVLPDPADRAHLSKIYFEKVAPNPSLTYYNLLHHLAESKSDTRAWKALEAVRSAVRSQFGDSFELLNDFYSFRSHHKRIFPNWHQDIEFWLTGSSCDGFNAWVLLDHERMNYSFDLYDVQSNRQMYDALYRRRFGAAGANYTTSKPLFSPSEYVRRSPGPGGFVAEPGHGKRRGASASSRSSSLGGAYGRVPLEKGDALIVRQVEIHRTDMHEIDTRQWRLAIGFKVVRKDLTLLKRPTASSPFGYDYEKCRSKYPGLIPALATGRPLVAAYNRTALQSLALRDASHDPLNRLISLLENPLLLVPLIGAGMLLWIWCKNR